MRVLFALVFAVTVFSGLQQTAAQTTPPPPPDSINNSVTDNDPSTSVPASQRPSPGEATRPLSLTTLVMRGEISMDQTSRVNARLDRLKDDPRLRDRDLSIIEINGNAIPIRKGGDRDLRIRWTVVSNRETGKRELLDKPLDSYMDRETALKEDKDVEASGDQEGLIDTILSLLEAPERKRQRKRKKRIRARISHPQRRRLSAVQPDPGTTLPETTKPIRFRPKKRRRSRFIPCLPKAARPASIRLRTGLSSRNRRSLTVWRRTCECRMETTH